MSLLNKFTFLASIFFIISCATNKLAPLPEYVTSSDSQVKFYLHPIKISDTRMGKTMRMNAETLYEEEVIKRLKKHNKLAELPVEADYELKLNVLRYYKVGAEGYFNPFSGGPKSDHIETAVYVIDKKDGKLIGSGNIFYRDSSMFSSLKSMIENSAQDILEYVMGNKLE